MLQLLVKMPATSTVHIMALSIPVSEINKNRNHIQPKTVFQAQSKTNLSKVYRLCMYIHKCIHIYKTLSFTMKQLTMIICWATVKGTYTPISFSGSYSLYSICPVEILLCSGEFFPISLSAYGRWTNHRDPQSITGSKIRSSLSSQGNLVVKHSVNTKTQKC